MDFYIQRTGRVKRIMQLLREAVLVCVCRHTHTHTHTHTQTIRVPRVVETDREDFGKPSVEVKGSGADDMDCTSTPPVSENWKNKSESVSSLVVSDSL